MHPSGLNRRRSSLRSIVRGLPLPRTEGPFHRTNRSLKTNDWKYVGVLLSPQICWRLAEGCKVLLDYAIHLQWESVCRTCKPLAARIPQLRIHQNSFCPMHTHTHTWRHNSAFATLSDPGHVSPECREATVEQAGTLAIILVPVTNTPSLLRRSIFQIS